MALVSTLWAAIGVSAAAHEVSATIGQISFEEGKVTVKMRMNAEAFIAGIDLDGLMDTNATDGSDEYDRLRALPPGALSVEMTAAAPRILSGMTLTTDRGVDVPLSMTGFDPGELGNVALPRASFLTLEGTIPEAARSLRFGWGKGYGTLILREMSEADSPYTGFLSGGMESPDLDLGRGGGFLGRLWPFD